MTVDVATVHAAWTTDRLAALLVEISGQSRSGLYRCPTPEHRDSTPSVSISDRDGRALWCCHGCGAGGDVVTLLEIVHGLSTGAAIQQSAEIAGLTTSGPMGVRSSMGVVRSSTTPDDVLVAHHDTSVQLALSDDAETDAGGTGAWIRSYARSRSLPEQVLYDAHAHTARRAWSGHQLTVLRLPCYDVHGDLGAWQDRTTPRDRRAHDGLPRWWTCRRPDNGRLLRAIGLETLRRPDAPSICELVARVADDVEWSPYRHDLVVVAEGPSDALSARAALAAVELEWIPVLGALGAGALAAITAALAASGRCSAVLLLPDGDQTGRDRAVDAVAAWTEHGGHAEHAAVVVAPDGADLSDVLAADGVEQTGERLISAHDRAVATGRYVAAL